METNTTGWGWNLQGTDQVQRIASAGLKLNLAISCSIHYPAWGKPIFECKHGITFPMFVVEGCSHEQLKEIHNS